MNTAAPCASIAAWSAAARSTLERSSWRVARWSTPEWREYSTMKLAAVKRSPSTTAESKSKVTVSATCSSTIANSKVLSCAHARRTLSRRVESPALHMIMAKPTLGTTPTTPTPNVVATKSTRATSGASLVVPPRSRIISEETTLVPHGMNPTVPWTRYMTALGTRSSRL